MTFEDGGKDEDEDEDEEDEDEDEDEEAEKMLATEEMRCCSGAGEDKRFASETSDLGASFATKQI